MFTLIRQLLALLSPRQLGQFYVLQALVVMMAFTELVGIASIAPFMALVGDISLLETNAIYARVYQWSGVTDPMDFLFYAGLAVLLALATSTGVAMFTIWRLALYGAQVGTEISTRLYTHYMQQNWLFHSSGSSAQLTKQVSTEAMRVTDGIVQPLIHMNAKLVLALFISVTMLVYEPMIAVGGLFLFGCAYAFLYQLVRKRLINNGRNMSRLSVERFRLMNEGFGGIKDVLLLDRRHNFVDRFQNSSNSFARASGVNTAISQVPRYFMELIAFGAMIGLVLILIKLHKGDLGTVLPILAVYALAAFKLLPALQQIYADLALIKGNSAAFEAIRADLTEAVMKEQAAELPSIATPLPLTQQISLNNITFNYPGKLKPAVKNLTLNIPVNSLVGLVGASGSGKSTAIDLLLGLLTAQQGELCIDGTPITAYNQRAWQNKIGFVPQSIFLSEGTIAENVAFGLAPSDINIEQVNKALQLASLTKLVNQLPEGLNTKVGERGVQLSGGQRQRIGIARALYNEAEVLVFDEATSALDGITEKNIMEAIYNLTGQKTIVMIAHRLKTVQQCDIIYLMEEGQVVDQGTYQQLIESNDSFKEMARYA